MVPDTFFLAKSCALFILHELCVSCVYALPFILSYSYIATYMYVHGCLYVLEHNIMRKRQSKKYFDCFFCDVHNDRAALTVISS